jgi:hypothetical protein
MKTSNLTFAQGFEGKESAAAKAKGAKHKAFDWDQAATIIKEHLKDHSDLTAEAGLEGDWDFTGGEIFEDGKPTNGNYTYLASNWATPTLILSWDGTEQKEIECFTETSERFNSDTKWDEESLKILSISL